MSDPEQTPVPAPDPAGPPADQTATGDLGKRPEPVMDAAKLAGVVSGVILGVGGLFKLLGVWIPSDYDLDAIASQAGNGVLAIGAAWTVVGPTITAAIKARNKVTPLEDPRDVAGRRLTPAGT